MALAAPLGDGKALLVDGEHVFLVLAIQAVGLFLHGVAGGKLGPGAGLGHFGLAGDSPLVGFVIGNLLLPSLLLGPFGFEAFALRAGLFPLVALMGSAGGLGSEDEAPQQQENRIADQLEGGAEGPPDACRYAGDDPQAGTALAAEEHPAKDVEGVI